MKSKLKITITTLQSLLLALAVFLSSAHAKDVVRTEALRRSDVVKIHSDDGTAKVSAELHNHVDKQTLKMFSHSGDTQQQADRRSLQLLEKEARDIKTEIKLGAALWLRLIAAKLML